MRHRLLIPLSLLVFGLTLLVLPAQAKAPPGATATVTFTDLGGCSVKVDYTWKGFNGQNLSAFYGVRWAGPSGGTEFTVSVTEYPVTGSGSASHTFDLTGYGSNVYYGAGQLTAKTGKTVDGSAVKSPTSASLSC